MIPAEWRIIPLHKIAEVRTGVAKGKQGLKVPVSVPYIRVANVQDGNIDLSEVKYIEIEQAQLDRYLLKVGDVLMTEGGDFDKLGRGDVWRGQIHPCLHQNHVFAVRPNDELLDSTYLAALSSSHYGKAYFLSCSKRSTNLASINSTQVKNFPVLLPTLEEQRAIIKTLSTWDAAIDCTQKLLENSRQQKKALMQQLLTGKKRLPGFSQKWAWHHMGGIAKPCGERNSIVENLPVLTCSKYTGFVDSLFYFKKQVFSEDTSTYKVIRRGEFGYPSNHIEEGAIGYQNLYDAALVSPIYVIFKVNANVNGDFLYSLLKTDAYRQIFSAATSASVDRRGSLRWPGFAKIKIYLPPVEEQTAIAEVLSSCNAVIAQYEAKLANLQTQKKALMQQLLTGKKRVRVDEMEAC